MNIHANYFVKWTFDKKYFIGIIFRNSWILKAITNLLFSICTKYHEWFEFQVIKNLWLHKYHIKPFGIYQIQ